METENTQAVARKVAVKVWRPALDKLDAKMAKACLRRDAYLTQLLDAELEYLDSEVVTENSEAARAYVARKFDLIPDKKLVTFVMRSDVVERMNEICKRKRIVRDAFLNRILLLLAASHNTFERFLGLDEDWKRHLMREYAGAPFLESSFYPIEKFCTPFWAARDWLREDNESIYRIFWDENMFKDVDLTGLNCHVHDNRLPGYPDTAYRGIAELL